MQNNSVLLAFADSIKKTLALVQPKFQGPKQEPVRFEGFHMRQDGEIVAKMTTMRLDRKTGWQPALSWFVTAEQIQNRHQSLEAENAARDVTHAVMQAMPIARTAADTWVVAIQTQAPQLRAA
jgi:hypothetical protein